MFNEGYLNIEKVIRKHHGRADLLARPILRDLKR